MTITSLHDLVPPDDPAADPDFLAAVADGLHAVAEPLTIVLDNTQDLTDPAAVDGLRSLLRDRPPHVRVVLAGRRDPPIPRGRLRAEGSLVEVRAEQLRFTGGRGRGDARGHRLRVRAETWSPRWSPRPAAGPRACASPRPRSPPRRRPTSSTTWSARTGPCRTTSSRRSWARSRRRRGTSSTG